MMRVRLKADGRLVEILADGTEAALKLPPPEADQRILAPPIARIGRRRSMPVTPAGSARRRG